MARKKAASKPIFTLYGEITMLGWEQAGQKLRDLDGKFKKFSSGASIVGRKMKTLGKDITLYVSAPLAAAAGTAIKFGADFDKAMTQSTAIMTGVNEDLRKQMEETARAISTESTVSAVEAAEAYYYLASAGKNAEESMALLPDVAKFAEAGQFDLATATDLLTDAQSALGMSSEDLMQEQKNMVRLSDVLIKATSSANATTEQFSEALTNKAAASLRSVNKDVEEGVAVLAAFADQGVKGREAGTQLAIVMRDLQNKALNNKDAFEDFGVAVFDENTNMNNMADIIFDMENALFGMSDAQKKATLMTLGFTDKSVAALLTLIGTSNKIKEYEQDLRNAAGTTEDVANKQLQHFWAQLEIVKNQLIDVAITVSEILIPPIKEYLIPAIKGLVDYLKTFTDALNNANPVFKQFVAILTGFGIIVGPTILGLGQLITVIGKLRTSLTLLKVAIIGNPIGLIATLVAGLGVAAFTAYTAYKNGNKALKENREEIQKQLDSKIHTQQTDLLEKVIERYQQLSDIDKRVIHRDEFNEAKQAIDSLETSLGDFGITFDGSFISKLDAAKNKLAELRGEVEDTGKIIFDELVIQGDSQEVIEKENKEKREKNVETFFDLLEFMRKRDEDQEKDKKKKELDAEIEFYKQKKENIKKINEKHKEQWKFEDDEADKKEKLEKEYADKQKERQKEVQDSIVNSIKMTGEIFENYYQTQINLLDNRYSKEKAYIEQTYIDEDERNQKLAELDEEYAAKKLAIRRKEAVVKKAFTIFDIGLNTASAIVEAISTPWMIPVISALAAAQLATVVSTPLPMKTGGYTEGSPYGSLAMIGEDNTKEIVMPLETGINKLTSGLIEKLGAAGSYGNSNSSAIVNTSANKAARNLTLNIGTFIGDDRGIKQLTRKIIPIINSESQRKAFA